ncbi:hypothetical protein [Propionivibrio sp.]|uniref:hypothetical protein n=1 Tax=Propionivibrio sp. TaxID=2212460 RepID=UPI003BF3DD81
MALTLPTAKRRLAQAWFFGAGAVAAQLLVLTLFGDQASVRTLWEGWFAPGVMPNLSLIVGVLVADFRNSQPGEEKANAFADAFLFKLAFWLSCTYLTLMLLTLLASPLTEVDFQTDLNNSRYFLAPLQALATAALGAFYVGGKTKE